MLLFFETRHSQLCQRIYYFDCLIYIFYCTHLLRRIMYPRTAANICFVEYHINNNDNIIFLFVIFARLVFSITYINLLPHSLHATNLTHQANNDTLILGKGGRYYCEVCIHHGLVCLTLIGSPDFRVEVYRTEPSLSGILINFG